MRVLSGRHVLIDGNMTPTQWGSRAPVERRGLSTALALTVVIASSAAVGQDAAELLKGRQALVKSCVDAVNAQGIGTFEAVVDAERVIHIYGSREDTIRFEKCLAQRESIAGTLLPKEKWRK